MSRNDFHSMLGNRPKVYLDSANSQKLHLGKLFFDCVAKIDELYDAQFDEATGVLNSVISPVGQLFVEYFLVPNANGGVRYFCVFYDYIEAPSGRIRRDVYLLALNTDGAWSDSTGKDIRFDFYSGMHGENGFYDIFSRIVEAHLEMNDERAENILKSIL